MGRRFRAHGRIPLTIVYSVVCAVLLVTVMVPAGAIAQSGAGLPPGVHLDPGNPTSKEYAIPLATARGGGGRSAGGQLFGAGVRPGGSSGGGSPPPTIGGGRVSRASSGGRRGRSGLRIAGRSHHRRSSKSIVAEQTPPVDAAGRVLGAGQGSGLLWMVAAAGIVLLSGLLGAFALTRRRDYRRAGPRMGL
jgi:hypothetical protein